MTPENDNNELIAKYLSGKLSSEEKREIKDKLKQDKSLAEEFDEIRGLSMGLRMLRKTETGHISISRLVGYTRPRIYNF